LAFLGSILILGLTVYFADFSKVLKALAQAERTYVYMTLFLGVMVLLFRSRVWFEFFRKLELEISSLKSFNLFSAGEFLNNVTTLGQAGGQPFMAYVISNNVDLEYEKSLATVISADFMTAMPLLSFGTLSTIFLFFNGASRQLVARAGFASVTAISIASFLVYFLWFKNGYIESKILRLSERVIRKDYLITKLEAKLNRVEETFETIGQNVTDLKLAAFYAHFSFALDVLVLYLALTSLGASINPLYLFIIFPIANLSKSFPTSGGSGAYELVLASMLSAILGLEFSSAVGAALMYRIATYWQAILIGAVSMSRFGLSISEYRS